MYGLKDQPFWIMEELIGAQGWDQIGYLPRPNQAKMWTYQALGHGAEAIVYFRWRACRFGTEQFCHGILDHDGKPKRKFEEIKEIKQELDQLGSDFIKSEPEAKVALYHSFDNMWAWQIQLQNSEFNYKEEIEKFYRPFFDLNISVDVRTDLNNLHQYEILLLPVLFLAREDKIEKIKEFVTQGGQLVLTYRSGVKDKDNIVTNKTLPGIFKELAGVEVNEYESLQSGRENSILWQEEEYQTAVWSDLLTLKTAKPLAYYKKGFYANTPAITVNKVGTGKVYYIGCSPEPAMLNNLYQKIVAQTNITPVQTPSGVEIINTIGEEKKYLIGLNHTDQPQTVSLPGEYSTLEGEKVTELNLDPFDAEVIWDQI